MISAPPQLEYAVRPEKARRAFRRMMGLVVIASIGFAAWKFGPEAFTQFNYLYVQRQLMNSESPADTVVFSLDPIEAKALLDRGYFHVDVGAKNSKRTAPPTAGHRSPAFVKSGAFLNAPLTGSGVFLHRRQARDSGEERLVRVQCFFLESAFGRYETVIDVNTWKPASMSLGSRIQASGYSFSSGSVPRFAFPEQPIRIFAGHMDKSESSRFIIPFDTKSGHFNLRGQLLPDSSIAWEIKG